MKSRAGTLDGAVEVEFDPERVSYEKLLEVFFASHDPSSRGRRTVDDDSQYRSAIFYHNEEQKRSALAVKERLEKSGRRIGTRNALASSQTIANKGAWSTGR